MRRLAIILCVMSVLVQPLSKQGVYWAYQLNKAYIAGELCENKSIPDSDCEGKCHLRKELKKDSEREQRSQRQQHTPLDMLVLGMEPASMLPAIPKPDSIGFSRYREAIFTVPYFSIFHPPRLSA